MLTTLLADEAPDLFPEAGGPRLRAASAVATATIPAGAWDPTQLPCDRTLLFICDGFLGRGCPLGHRPIAELLGPDDIIDPRPDIDGEMLSGAHAVRWHAHTPVRFALLDRGFLQRMAGAPEVMAAIMDRLAARSDGIAFLLAVSAQHKLCDRLLITLWAFAERWGRVTVDGVLLPVPLTHACLGELVGARRPACSTALAHLRSAGLVDRRPDGTWLLHDPPACQGNGRVAGEPAVALSA